MTQALRSLGWFRLVLLAQVAVGAVMVGAGIGSAPFRGDEIPSVSVGERGFGEIVDVLDDRDANMGLYYLLLHVWMWGGDSEAWIRLLSALSAVAAIPITAILARRLFGDAVAAASGFLLAASMFVVVHAQYARGYALALLAITIATLLFAEAIRTRRAAPFAAYGAASVLALYASPLSGVVLIAHLVSIAFLPGARALARPLAITYGLVLLAVAPLAVLMTLTGADQVSGQERPGLGDLFATAGWTLGGMPVGIAYGVLVAVGLVALWQGRGAEDPQREDWAWRRSLLVGWMLLPPVALFVVSRIEPLFQARYLLTSAPATAIVAALGLVALARRSRALGAAAAAILIGLAVLGRITLEPLTEEDHRAAARLIATEAEEGDGLGYAPAYVRLGVDWYLEREAPAGVDVPADLALSSTAEEVGGLYPREVPTEAVAGRLRDHRRVWVVSEPGATWHPTPEPMLDAGLPLLRGEFRRVLLRDLGDTRVELYERP